MFFLFHVNLYGSSLRYAATWALATPLQRRGSNHVTPGRMPRGLLRCTVHVTVTSARVGHSKGSSPMHIPGPAGRVCLLGPPVVPFYPFLGEGSPTKIDHRKTGTLIPTSLMEDLVWYRGW